jgi:hypothetical protein
MPLGHYSACRRAAVMSSTQAASTETAQRLIDPQLAAYEILRRMICRRPPFNAARPEAGEIPEDVEDVVETAALVYQLSMYLYIVERKFGLMLSEKVRANVLLLSAFDPGLESQIPRFLDLITRAEHACALRSGSGQSDDILVKIYSTLAVFTLIECGCPEERQESLHASVGARLGAAHIAAKRVLAPEVEAMNGVSKDFQWSAQPGPFERQLQRQQGNPLFPAPARSISAYQVSAARLEDLNQAADLLKSYKPLAQQVMSLTRQWTLREASDFWKKVIDLIGPGKTLGGYFSKEVQELERIADAVESVFVKRMDELNEPGFQEKCRTYRDLSSLAQLLRRVTTGLARTAGNEDVLRTVLSEDYKTISEYGYYTRAVGREDHLELAQRLIQAAVHDGMNGDVALLKLNAFRAGFDSAKPKGNSRIWQTLKKLLRRVSI